MSKNRSLQYKHFWSDSGDIDVIVGQNNSFLSIGMPFLIVRDYA